MISYANRGMDLEGLINEVNELYYKRHLALVQKISTPWKVIRKGKQIVSALVMEVRRYEAAGLIERRLWNCFPSSTVRQRQGGI